ncbi:MAG: DNA polymerase III subunit gamma/tau [Eubacterium sp.]|nr:DNA polymerase III subunit gamma/tau [Eubacterium sp.]
MAYQALYRKYRPKDFSDVRGQDAIVKTLKNQISSGHVGHAYLFTGTRGTGKTTVAKIFAKALNCENPGENGPCCQCSRCMSIEDGSSMNVVEIDGASNNKVEDIRQIIDEIQYSPADGGRKIYIIDEVHMVTPQAFNALLKTLEEPPEYMTFILATTDPQKVLPTILSRCQRYDFKRIPMEVMIDRMKELLEKEGIEAEDRALNYIARTADGALRDALSLLEECISYYFGEKLTFDKVLAALGAVDQTAFHELTSSIIKADVEKVVDTTEQITIQGKDYLQFARSYVWYLRNLLIVKTAKDVTGLIDMSEENIDTLKGFAEELETEQIIRYIHVVSSLITELRSATDRRVIFEVAMIRLSKPQMQTDYDSLIDQIQTLETEIELLKDKLDAGVYSVAAPAGKEAAKQAPKPEPKVIRPEAVPDDIKSVIQNWDHILGKVSAIPARGMLGPYLKQAVPSTDDEGRLVLAFSDAFARQYVDTVDGENMKLIRDTIAETIEKEVRVVTKDISEAGDRLATTDLRKIIKNVEIETID